MIGGNFKRKKVTLTAIKASGLNQLALPDTTILVRVQDRSREITSQTGFCVQNEKDMLNLSSTAISLEFHTIIAGSVPKKIIVQLVTIDKTEVIHC